MPDTSAEEKRPSAGRPEPSSATTPSLARYARLGRHLVLLGAVVLVVALAVQELRSRGTQGAAGLTIANYKAQAKVEDRPAPAFELPALDGGSTIALADFSGKVVVLNFWASWCGPCRAEAPHLQRTWETYRDRGVQFLGVNYRDGSLAANAYEDEFGITYPSVFDPAGKLAFDYKLLGLPTTFIITPDRQIAFQFVGKISTAILEDAIGDVLGSGGG